MRRGDYFCKKCFTWGTNFVAKIYWGIVLRGGGGRLNDQTISRGRSFTKFIFQQSEHYKTERFPQPWWHIHLKIKPGPFYRIMEGFILRLIVKRLGGFKVMSCYMRYWCNIWKVNTRNIGLNLKNTLCTQCLLGWVFHAKSVFFNIYIGDLHFFSGDIPKYWPCRLLGKVQFKRCLLVCWWRCGKLVCIGSIKWIAWQRGLARRTGSKQKLCMVPWHSYEI